MPNRLNFITQNGTLDAGDHAVLISHTAKDILTTQTGLYSDDDGIFSPTASVCSDRAAACRASSPRHRFSIGPIWFQTSHRRSWTATSPGALVDYVAQKLLHMNTEADPAREPTFTFFGNPNFFFESPPIATNTTKVVGTGFDWNHGDIQPEIGRTFIAIAGRVRGTSV